MVCPACSCMFLRTPVDPCHDRVAGDCPRDARGVRGSCRRGDEPGDPGAAAGLPWGSHRRHQVKTRGLLLVLISYHIISYHIISYHICQFLSTVTDGDRQTLMGDRGSFSAMVKNLPMVSFHQHTQRIATGLLDCSVAIFDLRSGAPPPPAHEQREAGSASGNMAGRRAQARQKLRQH